jgi:DNA-binding MarR family transcriptional regulator
MSMSKASAPDAPAPAGSEPALEIADLLGQVVRRLHRGTSEALAPLGLSRAQSRVVRQLADGPLRMATIAERLSVVPRTVTDLVDGVEAAGLVARHPDPEDRRSTFVELTPGGRLLLDRLEVARRKSAEQAVGRLDPADRALLLRLLRELTDEPADGCGPGVGPGPVDIGARPGEIGARSADVEAAPAGVVAGPTTAGAGPPALVRGRAR